jgi:plastocyanin
MTRKITLLAVVPALVWGLSACGLATTDPGASPSTSTTPSRSMPSTASTTTEPGGESRSAPDGAEQAVISITDFEFTVPTSVAPGAQISIKNGDSQADTVTSKTCGFDIKVDPDGTTTFPAPSKPGSYPFVCSFDGNMTSTLVVK